MRKRLWVLALVVGCGGADARIEDVLALEGDADSGAEVYASNCTSCHGSDGSGGSGPSLVEEVPHHSDEELLHHIIEGEGEMPSFADLEDQDLADLLAYLRAEHGG